MQPAIFGAYFSVVDKTVKTFFDLQLFIFYGAYNE